MVVAVAVARESLRFEQLSFMIRDLCTTHAWVRVALNLFDVGNSSEAGTSRQHASAASYGLHRCVTVSTIVGFKTRFWQQSLTPNRVQATHLFLIDSDMDFRPAVFDLLTFVRLSAAANVSILSPTPYGDGNGFFHLDMPRLSGNYKLTQHLCGKLPSQWAENCAVCRQPMVETKMPLFTAAAWRVVHDQVLRRMPVETLTTPEHIDLMWCNLIGHHLDGCDPSAQMGLPEGATNCLGRISCAYSYITPIRHLNDGEIRRRNISSRLSGEKTSSAEVWLDEHARKKEYSLFPTWRPKGSFLRREPCWNTSALAGALADWNASATRVPVVAPPSVKRAQEARDFFTRHSKPPAPKKPAAHVVGSRGRAYPKRQGKFSAAAEAATRGPGPGF